LRAARRSPGVRRLIGLLHGCMAAWLHSRATSEQENRGDMPVNAGTTRLYFIGIAIV